MLDLERRFVYDGWQMIAELGVNGPTLTRLRTYARGLDLTGTLHGAGGVGGLLLAKGQFWDSDSLQSVTTTLLPAYDGNGNVMGAIQSADGALAAAYEYDAYGQTLRATGPLARDFVFRFSTKWTDTETGELDYGRRRYSPSLGRFTSRDPIEEKGGLNLYAFVLNNPVSRWDYLGMDWEVTYNDDGTISVAGNFYNDAGDNWVYYTLNSEAELQRFLLTAPDTAGSGLIDDLEVPGTPARGMGALFGQLGSIAGMSGSVFMDSLYSTPDPVTFFPGPSDVSYLNAARNTASNGHGATSEGGVTLGPLEFIEEPTLTTVAPHEVWDGVMPYRPWDGPTGADIYGTRNSRAIYLDAETRAKFGAIADIASAANILGEGFVAGVQGGYAFADGAVPFLNPLAAAGAYNRNDPALQASQLVGGVTRDVVTVIGGGAVGAVARGTGVPMTAGQRMLVGEFGPSWTTVLTSANPLATRTLVMDYVGKWVGRIDTIIQANRLSNPPPAPNPSPKP